MQTRWRSMCESCSNVISGIFIAFGISQLAHVFEAQIQIYLWTDFHWDVSASSNLLMTLILTIVSIIRGYTWRRIFHRKDLELFKKQRRTDGAQ